MRASSMTELGTLLHELDSQQITYVSWKNNHELDACFRGESDLDLMVDPSRFDEFVEISTSAGWVVL